MEPAIPKCNLRVRNDPLRPIQSTIQNADRLGEFRRRERRRRQRANREGELTRQVVSHRIVRPGNRTLADTEPLPCQWRQMGNRGRLPVRVAGRIACHFNWDWKAGIFRLDGVQKRRFLNRALPGLIPFHLFVDGKTRQYIALTKLNT